MKSIVLLLAFAAALPTHAQLREAELTREGIAELQRRCEVQANNERTRLVLLTGRLLQSEFRGPPKPSCTSTLDEPCERYDWFPNEFTAVLTTTNHYKPSTKVAVRTEDWQREDLQRLDLRIGEPYAFCVAPVDRHRGMPHFRPLGIEHIYWLRAPTK